MWISSDIRGESLLLTLNSFELINPASLFDTVAQALLPVNPLLSWTAAAFGCALS
jgi:hypothetical protein